MALKVRYIADTQPSEIILRTLKYELVLQKYKWKEIEPEVFADLSMSYKTLLQREEDVLWDRKIFQESNRKIAFRRTFALGDLISFTPVINYLRITSNNTFILLTKNNYIDLFKSLGNFHDVIDINKYSKGDFDQIIYLDGILEDRGVPIEPLHMTRLFEKYLEIKIDKYDWSIRPQNKRVDIERC